METPGRDVSFGSGLWDHKGHFCDAFGNPDEENAEVVIPVIPHSPAWLRLDRLDAAQDMFFGIPEGECFGYLGLNGAGKTTTMPLGICRECLEVL